MTDATNPVETSSNMQPRSLPTRWYTLTRCCVTSSSIRKSVHLLFRQTGMILVLMIGYKIWLTMCLPLDGPPLYSHSNAPLKHYNDRRPVVLSLTLHTNVLPFDGAVLSELVIWFHGNQTTTLWCHAQTKLKTQPGTPGNRGIPSVTAFTNEALLYPWQQGFDLTFRVRYLNSVFVPTV